MYNSTLPDYASQSSAEIQQTKSLSVWDRGKCQHKSFIGEWPLDSSLPWPPGHPKQVSPANKGSVHEVQPFKNRNTLEEQNQSQHSNILTLSEQYMIFIWNFSMNNVYDRSGMVELNQYLSSNPGQLSQIPKKVTSLSNWHIWQRRTAELQHQVLQKWK